MSTDPTPVDWATIGRRWREAETHFGHRTKERLYGEALDTAIARRALGADRPTWASYECVDPALGLVTDTAMSDLLDAQTGFLQRRVEALEEQIRELRREIAIAQVRQNTVLAGRLREWVNDRRVPSQLRREGFLMAIDQIENPTL